MATEAIHPTTQPKLAKGTLSKSLHHTTKWELRIEDFKPIVPCEAIEALRLIVLSQASPSVNAKNLARSYDHTMQRAIKGLKTSLRESISACESMSIPLNPYLELLSEVQSPEYAHMRGVWPSFTKRFALPRQVGELIKLAILQNNKIKLNFKQRITLGNDLIGTSFNILNLDDETIPEMLKARAAVQTHEPSQKIRQC